jgi:mRNA-degrading endonuclease RelE of RelBE toxin-antitoxin system
VALRPESLPYDVGSTPTADKQISRLSIEQQTRVLDALRRLAVSLQGDWLQIGKGYPGLYRLRVDGLRVFFDVEERLIVVTGIEKRGEAYRRKSRNR